MKKLILGMVIGLLVGTTGTALASSDLVGTKVQAVFASFNLVINGVTKEMETAPLVYNGTSYLPVKEIANLTGFDVTYKADSRTIELNSATPKPTEKVVNEMTTETVKPEKVGDVDRTAWPMITDLTDYHGITYAARPNGESLLKKGTLVFTIPPYDRNWPSNSETSYTDGEITIRVKFVSRYIFFNADDLRAAGFIN